MLLTNTVAYMVEYNKIYSGMPFMTDYLFDYNAPAVKTFEIWAKKNKASYSDRVILDDNILSIQEFIKLDAVKSYLFTMSNVRSSVALGRNVFDSKIFGCASAGVIIEGSCLCSTPAETGLMLYDVWKDWFLDATLKNNEPFDFTAALSMWIDFAKSNDGREIKPEDMGNVVLLNALATHPIFGPAYTKMMMQNPNDNALEQLETGMRGLSFKK